VGGPPAWGLGGGLTTLPRETQYLLRITMHSLGAGRITWHNLCTGKWTLNQVLRIEAAKAAARPTARLREVTRVPTGRPPTPPERRRNERPVCWQCGKSGHFWRDCRQRRPGQTGQGSRTRTEVTEPSIKPPRYAVNVLAEWAKGSLISDGWVQEKPCRVTIDTGGVCDCR
jgi:hypothetical protein